MPSNLKHHSHIITDGPDRAGARSMLKSIGFTDEDLAKPIVGIANTWIETMPCNYHLRALAEKVKAGVRAAGGTPMELNTIAISDGVTMGTEGMKASLISREVIADSIELVGRGHMFDAMVALVGCDKTIPGGAMALIRLNVPSVLLYGGSIAAGRFQDRDVTVGDVYEAVGAHAAGKMTDAELKDLEDHACPGAGACGGQFTANTMSTVMEFIGLSPMGLNSIPALDPKKDEAAFQCGHIVMDLLKRGVKPLDILTRKAFENAIASVAATGGSTNAVLHLLAMAREANVPLAIEDFDVISSRTPIIADLKPGGRFVAVDVHHASPGRGHVVLGPKRSGKEEERGCATRERRSHGCPPSSVRPEFAELGREASGDLAAVLAVSFSAWIRIASSTGMLTMFRWRSTQPYFDAAGPRAGIPYFLSYDTSPSKRGEGGNWPCPWPASTDGGGGRRLVGQHEAEKPQQRHEDDGAEHHQRTGEDQDPTHVGVGLLVPHLGIHQVFFAGRRLIHCRGPPQSPRRGAARAAPCSTARGTPPATRPPRRTGPPPPPRTSSP